MHSIQLQFSSSIEAPIRLPDGSFEICQKHTLTHPVVGIKIHSMAIKPAYRTRKQNQINRRSPRQANPNRAGQEARGGSSKNRTLETVDDKVDIAAL